MLIIYCFLGGGFLHRSLRPVASINGFSQLLHWNGKRLCASSNRNNGWGNVFIQVERSKKKKIKFANPCMSGLITLHTTSEDFNSSDLQCQIILNEAAVASLANQSLPTVSNRFSDPNKGVLLCILTVQLINFSHLGEERWRDLKAELYSKTDLSINKYTV